MREVPLHDGWRLDDAELNHFWESNTEKRQDIYPPYIKLLP